jgi:hypothetical protein
MTLWNLRRLDRLPTGAARGGYVTRRHGGTLRCVIGTPRVKHEFLAGEVQELVAVGYIGEFTQIHPRFATTSSFFFIGSGST